MCSAPDARASFLLLRQKKGAKEKAPPGRRPACGGVPCATRLERGLRNSGFALRQCSPTSPLKPALLGTSQGNLNTDRSPLRLVFLLPSVSSSSAEYPATPGDSAGAPSSWQDKKKFLACRRNTAFHQPSHARDHKQPRQCKQHQMSCARIRRASVSSTFRSCSVFSPSSTSALSPRACSRSSSSPS